MSRNKIDRHEIEKALLHMHILKPTQREYIKGVLMEDMDYGGVDKHELRRRLSKLGADHTDRISSYELKHLKETLNGLLEDSAKKT